MKAPTVLIMDDNPDVRCVLHESLAELGYQPVTVADGEMGLQLALRDKPDLMIIDMMMPRKSGFQVLKQVRDSFGTETPVIMISANAGPEHQAYASVLGADTFIEKPFKVTQLTDAVERLCPLDGRGVQDSFSLSGSIH